MSFRSRSSTDIGVRAKDGPSRTHNDTLICVASRRSDVRSRAGRRGKNIPDELYSLRA